MKKSTVSALCLLCCITLTLPLGVSAYAAPVEEHGEVILGGALFGVQVYTDGVLVVGVDKVTPPQGQRAFSPAYDAGIRLKDVITEIDGRSVTDVNSVTERIRNSDGKTLKIKIKRGDTEKELSLTPTRDAEGRYRIGISIRDTAAGIGTVTYVDPATGEFAGLGHGICDADTGTLMQIKRGVVTDVELTGIQRGQRGIPGELIGNFGTSKQGALLKNTDRGVYGIFGSIPHTLDRKIRLAPSSEVKEGTAVIRCAVSGRIEEYGINISRLDKNGSGTKNFTVTVTDERLLSLTGGIVQGMSGSPIIQNGKLIGAVTHVLVKDPTTGYGIYIENMLPRAERLAA